MRLPDLVAHWSERTPAAPALSDPQQSLSYRELDAALDSAAGRLVARGVRAGDRVSIVAENDVVTALLLLAAQRLNAWPAIINARIAPMEIAVMRARADARLTLFCTRGSAAALALAGGEASEPLAPELPGVMCTVNGSATAPESAPADVGLLLFTSGTTGLPKAVMLGHRGLVELGQILALTRHVTSVDSLQGTSPLSHIMGIASLAAALAAGASLDLTARLDLGPLVTAIATGQRTQLSTVPTVFLRICEYVTTHSVDLSGHRMRYLSSGGAPLDPGLKARVEALFGLRLVNAYGMTECAPGCRSLADRDSPADCVGWPEPGVRARIVNVETEMGDSTARQAVDVSGDLPGELWLQSPSMLLGYYRDAAATAQALTTDGWYATGDLARWLPDGSIAIVGRLKEMIIRSGFNVYPAEVEAALNAQPGVLHSGVVGREMANRDEEVVAFVQPSTGARLNPEQLRQALRDFLAPYKIPSRIVVVEQLPLGSTGKVRKAALREMARDC